MQNEHHFPSETGRAIPTSNLRVDRYLATPFDKSKSHANALVKEPYALSNWELFKACIGREWLLIKRNKFLYVFRTCQVGVILITRIV